MRKCNSGCGFIWFTKAGTKQQEDSMKRMAQTILIVVGSLAVLSAVGCGGQDDGDIGVIKQAVEEGVDLPFCAYPYTPGIDCYCTPETPDSVAWCLPYIPCTNGGCFPYYCGLAGKVAFCHKGHNICVSANASKAHFKHGDIIGGCLH
jgi:hypothetical protein